MRIGSWEGSFWGPGEHCVRGLPRKAKNNPEMMGSQVGGGTKMAGSQEASGWQGEGSREAWVAGTEHPTFGFWESPLPLWGV